MIQLKKELRFIITRNCNYNCYFCHGEGIDSNCKQEFNAEDYEFIFKVCKDKYKWDTVTLTGGEPLVRKDFNEIIAKLHEEDANVTIVTNGELIDKNMESIDLVQRINISIHSLDEIKYNNIIQKENKLDKVIQNLMEVRNRNKDTDIRINTTVIKNINDDDKSLLELIKLATKLKGSIKFIELYSEKKEEIVTLHDLQERMKKFGFKYKPSVGKVVMYNGQIELIFTKIFCALAEDYFDPNEYCHNANDLFVTPDGFIKMCRNSKDTVSIFEEVKNKDIKGLETKINMANSILGVDCSVSKEKNSEIALYGGSPLLSQQEGRFIHPIITKDIEVAVIDQLYDTISIYDNSNIFGKFEYEFARYHNKKYGLVTSSGTTAIWSMYEGIRLREGDEVICPIYTFHATVTPIFFTGALPIFIDCDETGNIDYSRIESKITSRTKAIVVTHMWGYPCKMDKIRQIADKYNIYLLEDCSHAHGGVYKGKKLGEWGDAAAFSLQGQKVITGGEGGVLITNNKYIYKNSVLLGHYNKRCKKDISPDDTLYKYSVTGKGMKLRAHPIAIRIAYEMFKHIDEYIKIKNCYTKYIFQRIERIEGLKANPMLEDSQNSWYSVIIHYDSSKFNGTTIQEFVKALNAEGGVEFDIPTSTYPLDKLELFNNPSLLFPKYNTVIDSEYIAAKEFASNILKLPVWYRQEDFKIVVKYMEILEKVSLYYKNNKKVEKEG